MKASGEPEHVGARQQIRDAMEASQMQLKYVTVTEGAKWPSEPWRVAMRRQATAATMAAAVRFAEVELRRLATFQVAVDVEAADLVQAVLTSTCSGQLTWKPTAVSLLPHVCDMVRLTCRRLRRRHVRDRRTIISIDAIEQEHAAWDDIEAALAANLPATVPPELVDCARRVEAAMWRLVESDQPALRVLHAWSDGEMSDDAIAELTGLTTTEIANAKKRIRRMTRHLPAELRSDVETILH